VFVALSRSRITIEGSALARSSRTMWFGIELQIEM